MATNRAMVAAILLVGLVWAQAQAAPRAKVKGPAYVPDPSAPASAGDRAIAAINGRFAIADPSIHAALDRGTFAALGLYLSDLELYSKEVGDLVLLQKRAIVLPGRTPVDVVAIAPHADFHPKVGDGAEVVVLAGPFAGRKLWVRRQDLVRMVGRAKAKAGSGRR